MSSCVHIQLRQEDIGMIYLKSSFDGEFEVVDLNRNIRKSKRLDENGSKNLLIKKSVPISAQKYNDLISLLPFIPSIFHGFYKDLPKTNDNNQDYPASDNESDFIDD